jgi:hypothetical protein
MEFTDSVAPGPNDHGRRCRRNPEICARRRAFLSPDEVVNGVEADQSHDDQIDRHDEAQQPRHDQDQDAGEEGDEQVSRTNFGCNHFPLTRIAAAPRQIDQRTWVAAAASSSES